MDWWRYRWRWRFLLRQSNCRPANDGPVICKFRRVTFRISSSSHFHRVGPYTLGPFFLTQLPPDS
ncbi:protein of unknown function [Stenotrophomonas maltophilia]|nr:protein of unknown function [Stenotrophomonas maltophilia]